MNARIIIHTICSGACLLPLLASAHPGHITDGAMLHDAGDAGWIIGGAVLAIVVAVLAAWCRQATDTDAG